MPNYLYGKDSVELNANRAKLTLDVTNTGDRAVQVGSHYHFFEANPALQFDRDRTLGMHLNIAAGTAVRFEPGESHRVELCAFGGTGRFIGFSGLLNGSVISHPVRVRAVREAIEEGFKGADTTEPKHAAKPTSKAKPKTTSRAKAKATSKRGTS